MTRRDKPRAPIRSAKAFRQLSPRQREAHQRSVNALSYARQPGASVSGAARRAGTTVPTMRRYVGSAIVESETGRLSVKKSDTFYRELHFLTPHGRIVLGVTNSRTASRIARYWAAVDRHLKTGKTDALREFRGKSIRVGKVAYPFITDPKTLNRLGRAGEVSFEDLYAR